uniref:Uncharacterized protein n=1 Tax=Chromera velia CCMP2878 TaxID=1169474 RepID=A0A0G4GJQ8_9ALVE|eukprot:Cvel_4803.t1-p1 / transcript=Cvel_4803.t1 / gene=Cvel_4803 / organism=Chromera_velia_CCMP2878 / gene_product=Ankyrin repeat and KH domain-containing protein, putative / transcript_product=Ankyrin repeat and KH domain-containing protein, putative / location=Cvel_scaffold215:23052-23549(+) / protein_length=166 / sequence_SO=supercontig / SO=protein_coding / is_pseudo=false
MPIALYSREIERLTYYNRSPLCPQAVSTTMLYYSSNRSCAARAEEVGNFYVSIANCDIEWVVVHTSISVEVNRGTCVDEDLHDLQVSSFDCRIEGSVTPLTQRDLVRVFNSVIYPGIQKVGHVLVAGKKRSDHCLMTVTSSVKESCAPNCGASPGREATKSVWKVL